MCVCCFGCVPSHTSQRRRSFGRPEDASSARRSFCIAQAPPADTRRVEPSKASTRSSNRSSTRSSSVTSATARAGRGPTPRGARTRCPGRPRARRRPWTTGRSRCPSRASSHRVEVAQRRRRELRARERARDALGALVRLPRHEARVLEAVHARRAPRAAQTYVPRSPVLQIVGDARLKRSDDAVSWRCASQDIMRVLRPRFSWRTGCACRLHGVGEVLEDAHLDRDRAKSPLASSPAPKNQKKTTSVVRGCWTCAQGQKKEGNNGNRTRDLAHPKRESSTVSPCRRSRHTTRPCSHFQPTT